jgi:hypothetical protein
MQKLSTIDILALNSQKNIDNIINFNPYSSEVEIKKLSDTTNTETFGYEQKTIDKVVITKAIILFNPEKRKLRMMGIFVDDTTKLPVIGIFKHIDNIKKKDIVYFISKDIKSEQIYEHEMVYEVIDVLTHGKTENDIWNVFHLAPYRGDSKKLQNTI